MEAPESIRFLLTVHYDGSSFHGWQIQPNHRTIQGTLQDALTRLAAQPRTVLGSGRTDTGVHALGQVAAVDMPPSWSSSELRRALNATLPEDIWIEAVAAVRPDFHPRYDAVRRTYTYDVGIDPTSASPFHCRWCWPLCEELDAALLDQGAARVIGKHSFGAFCKSGQPERGEECTVTVANWSEWELGRRFTITADRYLHHMVRYLVRTFVDVARGRRSPSDVPSLLHQDRGVITSPPAPPQGLFLRHVEYPEDVLLGTPPSTSPSRRTATV